MVGICSIKSTSPTIMGCTLCHPLQSMGMQSNQYPFHPKIRFQMVMKKSKEQQNPLPVWKIWCHCPSESEEDIKRFREKLKESPFPVFNGMPLHYPRFKKADYEAMPEWRVELLLQEYGLPVKGSLQEKRNCAISAFLFPDQLVAEDEEKMSSSGH